MKREHQVIAAAGMVAAVTAAAFVAASAPASATTLVASNPVHHAIIDVGNPRFQPPIDEFTSANEVVTADIPHTEGANGSFTATYTTADNQHSVQIPVIQGKSHFNGFAWELDSVPPNVQAQGILVDGKSYTLDATEGVTVFDSPNGPAFSLHIVDPSSSTAYALTANPIA